MRGAASWSEFLIRSAWCRAASASGPDERPQERQGKRRQNADPRTNDQAQTDISESWGEDAEQRAHGGVEDKCNDIHAAVLARHCPAG